MVVVVAALQSSSSQKHMCPLPPPSVMHTWPTMNRLMSTLSVQVRRTFSIAERKKKIYCYFVVQLYSFPTNWLCLNKYKSTYNTNAAESDVFLICWRNSKWRPILKGSYSADYIQNGGQYSLLMCSYSLTILKMVANTLMFILC